MKLTLTEVLPLLEGVKKLGSGYTALCPAHDDKRPSLSINEENGKLLLRCHAECTFESIVEAIRAKGSIGCSAQSPKRNGAKQVVARYPYVDESGKLLYEIERLVPKDFLVRRKMPNGSFEYKLGDCRRVLFRLPQVIAAIRAGKIVYLCEGEKDVIAVEGAGGIGTTNVFGASSWDTRYTEALNGADVVVLVDRDEAGAKRAKMLKAKLSGVVKSLVFVQAAIGHDAHDHLAAGKTLEELEPYEFPEGVTVVEGHRFVSLTDLLQEEPEEVSWLVEGLLPRCGLGLLVSKPKVGKTTLIRELIVCVVDGEQFLGRDTQQGNVVYIALEENREFIRKAFATLNVKNPGSLFFIFTKEQCHDAQQLAQIVDELKPALVIIDTLIKFVRIKDINDYAEVSGALEPLSNLARSSNIHILFAHHSRKGEVDDSGDASLGSTALFGSVDTLIRLRRVDKETRLIDSVQRYGEALELTEISFDRQTQRCNLGAAKAESEIKSTRERVIYELSTGPKTNLHLKQTVGSRGLSQVLNTMLAENLIQRSGKGVRNHGFTFSIADSNSDSVPLYREIPVSELEIEPEPIPVEIFE